MILTPPLSIDLNCDLGEYPARLPLDLQLASVVTSLNIACGGHAGDARTMRALLEHARSIRTPLSVGAHPSYPDRANFGRRHLAITLCALEDSLHEQLQAFHALAAQVGIHPRHVKPHGALYHAAMNDPDIALTFARAVSRIDPALMLMGQAGRPGLDVWRRANFKVIPEGFADRRYEPDGSLRDRTLDDSLLHNPAEAAAQALSLAQQMHPPAPGGSALSVRSICIHSDSPNALACAREVRCVLENACIPLCPPFAD